MRPYKENRYLQVLHNTAVLNSYLGLFALCKIFFGLHMTLTREVTLCQNILNGNALQKFTWISKFCCFLKTKQTQNKVEIFFYNLAEFVFEYFCDSLRILTSFVKFFRKSLFAIIWSYHYLNPKCSCSRPSSTRNLMWQIFTKSLPYSQLLYLQNQTKHFCY